MNSKVIINRVDCPEHIDGNELLKIKNCGNVIEAVYMPNLNASCRIKKISKDEYIALSTGEVCKFDHSKNRSDLLNSVRQSLNRLRDYINTNVTDCAKCRWITLTYGENMTDHKRLYSDFNKFIKRMRYRIGGFEYITAIEPQERGAWHAHIIAIFTDNAPFIPNDELEQLWGHGFTKIKAVNDVDNLGLYFTAYLADMELTDENGLKVLENTDNAKIKDKANKQIVKGGRLYMYPSGINIYRISNGIKPPDICKMTENDLQEKTKDLELLHERAILVSIPPAENGASKEFMIYYRYFNKLRKKGDCEEISLFKQN